MHEAYSGGKSSRGVDLAAYLTVRLPATYAAVAQVLTLIADVDPSFAPQSLIDVGAGPGTASWAAAAQWPSLNIITMLECDHRFAGLAQQLKSQSPDQPLAEAALLHQPMTALSTKADCIIAAYVFAEQGAEEAGKVAIKLWENTMQTLIIIEPGTPEGFKRVRAAREFLRGQGAFIIGPCTHHRVCPMAGGNWCHFKTRVQRSRAHLQAKNASVPFEDEAFSWIAMTRQPVSLKGARVIAPPASAKPGITLTLCDDGKVTRTFIASRTKPDYKRVKKLKWGDRFVAGETDSDAQS